jgi:diketogulonate reductase-like aldo/keto reductase
LLRGSDELMRRSINRKGEGEIAVSEVGVFMRELGEGVSMPALGLGLWQMAEGRETEQAVEWALDAGYRHFDTATMYKNERSVGAAIARSGLSRQDLFVTTKWLPLARSASSELARSLERLQLDYVDLYLIHWPVPLRTRRGWPDLERLREGGLARTIGVSNYGSERLTRLVQRSAHPPAVNQVQFSPFQFRRKLLEACARQGVVLEAYSPLERGRSVDHPVIVEIAQRLERTPAQVMLRWGIQHNAVVIPKSSHEERIRSNAQIFDFTLGASDMRTLDSLDRTNRTRDAR